METVELLERLEELVENSRQFFNKAILNADDFFALTRRLKTSLPEDVKSASRITREADNIIGDAKEQGAQIIDQSRADAARIVEDANTRAAELVDESEIKRLASAQAKEIIASAEDEARGVKAGADEYANEVLSNLESFVTKVLSTIQHGRDKLQHKSDTESE